MRGAKVLAIAVAFLCAVAFMPILSDSMQSQAATKLKVSKTKVTVTVGKSVKVTANKKKATWKSAKTTVANLTRTKGSSVYIQGIKKGTTKVTVKYGKQKKVITVTVKAAPKPATPTPPPKNKTVNPSGYVKEGDVSVTGYYQGDATIYSLLYQESAEVAAQQIQAFSLAKVRLDEAIAEHGGDGNGLAIITDIDSTIADDTCYIAGAVLDAAGRTALKMEPWNNDDWNGYYEAVATEADTVIPGAKQFVDYAYGKGVQFYYITNRPYYELDLTVQQLAKQGFFDKDPTVADGKGIVETFAVAKNWQDYYYCQDPQLSKDKGYDPDGPYSEAINATGVMEIAYGSYSVKDDYRVQVQGTGFDSDKTDRRANVFKTVGRDNVVLYMGDSINDMVSDSEKAIWSETNPNAKPEPAVRAKDFTRKQFNDSRTENAKDPYWAGDWGTGQSVGEGDAYNPGHWGKDFIVLPNATYGDWYKATWSKKSGLSVEEQQGYIYDQIWAHSYKNSDKFDKWYTNDAVSPVTPDIQ